MKEAATTTSVTATGDVVAAELLQSSVRPLVMMRQSTTRAVMLEDTAGGVREPGSGGLEDKAASTADTRAGNAPSIGAPPPRLPSAAPSARGSSAAGSAGEGTGLGLSFYKVAVAVFVLICTGLRAAKRRLAAAASPRLALLHVCCKHVASNMQHTSIVFAAALMSCQMSPRQSLSISRCDSSKANSSRDR